MSAQSDITEMKAMKKPSNAIKMTMAAICIMLGVAPDKKCKEGSSGLAVPTRYVMSHVCVCMCACVHVCMCACGCACVHVRVLCLLYMFGMSV